MSQQYVEQLKKYFIDSQSLVGQVRETATEAIKEFVKNPQATIVLLDLIKSNELDSQLRQFLAILFKNQIKENYQDKDTTENLITEENKKIIKDNIIGVLLGCSVTSVQNQLLESISLISQSDFPIGKWDDIVPKLSLELENLVNTNNYPSINKVLVILEIIFKKFRDEMKTDITVFQIQKILEVFPTVFLKLVQKTGSIIANSTNEAELVTLFQSVKIQMEIFYSLNRVDIPEFFEDNLKAFTDEFHRYLRYKTTVVGLVEGKSEEDPSLLNEVQTSICEILNIYTQLYDDEISEFLQSFVEDIWTLLSQTSSEIKNDKLVFSAIKFLSLVSMSIKYTLFQNEQILKTITGNIIIPNLKLRECDIELWEDNKVEYMRRDIEGSDSDTRRRAGIELVKGLRKYFQEPITQLLSKDIQNLIANYNANPQENWLSKDTAIFTVTALAVKSDDQSDNKLIPILQFYLEHIASELAKQNIHDILRADCLKFISIFRTEIPAQYYGQLLQLIIPCLSNPDFVVHTYASTCIDRLMTVKDAGVPRLQLSQNDLPAILLPLVNVFQFTCSKNNERTMRAIVRIVLSMIGKIDQPTTISLLKKFTDIMLEAAKNPANHLFNHYSFEVIGSLLKTFSSEKEIFSLVTPLIQYVLQNDVAEFSPYCYQLLCILVESAKPEFLETYRAILIAISQAVVWNKPGNIPALSRLVQAFFKREQQFIVSSKLLGPFLGVFKKLIASPAHDHEGFYILESMAEHFPIESYQEFVSTIFDCIYTRIVAKKTEKVLRCYIIFLNIFIIKNGVDTTIKAIKSIDKENTLWGKTLDKLFLPTVMSISGDIEKKIISIGMTNLLCNNSILSDQDTWTRMLRALYSLFTGTDITKETTNPNGDTESYLEQSEQEGYTPSFTQLQFSKKQDVDPFPSINPKNYFKAELTKFAQSNQAVNSILQANPDINFSVL